MHIKSCYISMLKFGYKLKCRYIASFKHNTVADTLKLVLVYALNTQQMYCGKYKPLRIPHEVTTFR